MLLVTVAVAASSGTSEGTNAHTCISCSLAYTGLKPSLLNRNINDYLQKNYNITNLPLANTVRFIHNNSYDPLIDR